MSFNTSLCIILQCDKQSNHVMLNANGPTILFLISRYSSYQVILYSKVIPAGGYFTSIMKWFIQSGWLCSIPFYHFSVSNDIETNPATNNYSTRFVWPHCYMRTKWVTSGFTLIVKGLTTGHTWSSLIQWSDGVVLYVTNLTIWQFVISHSISTSNTFDNRFS